MTTIAPPSRSLSLADARLLWSAANLAERQHADRCRLNRLGMSASCGDCREYAYQQDVAEARVHRIRTGQPVPSNGRKEVSRPV
jgi:hypothetical protein